MKIDFLLTPILLASSLFLLNGCILDELDDDDESDELTEISTADLPPNPAQKLLSSITARGQLNEADAQKSPYGVWLVAQTSNIVNLEKGFIGSDFDLEAEAPVEGALTALDILEKNADSTEGVAIYFITADLQNPDTLINVQRCGEDAISMNYSQNIDNDGMPFNAASFILENVQESAADINRAEGEIKAKVKKELNLSFSNDGLSFIANAANASTEIKLSNLPAELDLTAMNNDELKAAIKANPALLDDVIAETKADLQSTLLAGRKIATLTNDLDYFNFSVGHIDTAEFTGNTGLINFNGQVIQCIAVETGNYTIKGTNDVYSNINLTRNTTHITAATYSNNNDNLGIIMQSKEAVSGSVIRESGDERPFSDCSEDTIHVTDFSLADQQVVNMLMLQEDNCEGSDTNANVIATADVTATLVPSVNVSSHATSTTADIANLLLSFNLDFDVTP
ncbi:MAG: hypothetical protein HRU20_07925 [Pseudomonadales bacterium]|nr:hypothetical protein [Pseudomonadales bacterium]